MVDRFPRPTRYVALGRPVWPRPNPNHPYVPVLKHMSKKNSRFATKSLLKNIIKYERIITTYHRAMVTKHWGERLIEIVKNGSWNAMEEARKHIDEGEVLEKLCLEIPVRYLRQDGDYIHIYRIPNRLRDGAKMAIVELRDNPYPSLYPALGLGLEPEKHEEKESLDDGSDKPMKWKFVEYPDDPLPDNVPKMPASALEQPPPPKRKVYKTKHDMAQQHKELVGKHFEERDDFFKQLMMSKKERDAHLAKRKREEEVAMPWLYRTSWDIQGIQTVTDFKEFVDILERRRERVAEARKRHAAEDAAAAGKDGTAV